MHCALTRHGNHLLLTETGLDCISLLHPGDRFRKKSNVEQLRSEKGNLTQRGESSELETTGRICDRIFLKMLTLCNFATIETLAIGAVILGISYTAIEMSS